jgi:hypothetical protein
MVKLFGLDASKEVAPVFGNGDSGPDQVIGQQVTLLLYRERGRVFLAQPGREPVDRIGQVGVEILLHHPALAGEERSGVDPGRVW